MYNSTSTMYTISLGFKQKVIFPLRIKANGWNFCNLMMTVGLIALIIIMKESRFMKRCNIQTIEHVIHIRSLHYETPNEMKQYTTIEILFSIIRNS